MGIGDTTGDVNWDDPELKAAVNWLIGALTGPDERTRRGVAAKVSHGIHPAVRARVVGLLVGRLGSRSRSSRTQAAEALLGIGEPGLPAMLNRLRKHPRAAVLTGLADVLAGVGRTLTPEARVPVQLALSIALGFAPDLDSAWAVARALVQLRPDEPAPGEEDPAEVASLVMLGAKTLLGGRPPEGKRRRRGRGTRQPVGPAVRDDG